MSYKIVCESIKLTDNMIKNGPKSTDLPAPLTWNNLTKYLKTIKDKNILNTTVCGLEHHHYNRIRFYPQFIDIGGRLTIVPYLQFMYNGSNYQLDRKNPYSEQLLNMHKQNTDVLKKALTYSDIINHTSKLSAAQRNQPIHIFNIWNLTENKLFTNPEKECIHFSGDITIKMDDLLKEREMFRTNPKLSYAQKKESIADVDKEIHALFHMKKANNNSSVAIGYYQEHPYQPILGIWEF